MLCQSLPQPAIAITLDHLSPEHAKKRRPNPTKPKTSAPKKQLLVDQVSESLVNQLYTHPKPRACQSCVSLIDRFRGVDALGSSTSSRSSSSGTLLNSSSPGSEATTPPVSPHNHSAIFSEIHEPSDTSESSLDELDRTASAPAESKQPRHADVFTLDDFTTTQTIKRLATRYGRVSHMGILDKSYSFFINKRRTAALSFKVQSKVAIVAGDPLCDTSLYGEVLKEFEEYRKRHKWGIAFMGASDDFVEYAKTRHWTTLQFAAERVLNPMTNDVLFERSGKRMIVQNKQLLCPTKGGITLGLYVPARGEDPALQKELVAIYDSWRLERNRSSSAQAFITVYDPFSLPHMMTYLYTRGPDGVANGFAALRKIGASKGYHIDPCIPAPGAPKGISDLLVFAAMALLNRADVSYLSLGFEPLDFLGEMTGMPRPLQNVTRTIYRHTFPRLPIGGKKAYHDKFRPDRPQESNLYLVFPTGLPTPRQVMAIAHMANISIRKLVFADNKENNKRAANKPPLPAKENNHAPGKSRENLNGG